MSKRRKPKRPRPRKLDPRHVAGMLTIVRVSVLPEWLWAARIPHVAADVFVDQEVRAIIEAARA